MYQPQKHLEFSIIDPAEKNLSLQMLIFFCILLILTVKGFCELRTIVISTGNMELPTEP
jgi:hypothetical protein